jgi:hypothetical protein
MIVGPEGWRINLLFLFFGCLIDDWVSNNFIRVYFPHSAGR